MSFEKHWIKENTAVIPAKAGIQKIHEILDSRFRGNDETAQNFKGVKKDYSARGQDLIISFAPAPPGGPAVPWRRLFRSR
jgi:hypothetical protein